MVFTIVNSQKLNEKVEEEQGMKGTQFQNLYQKKKMMYMDEKTLIKGRPNRKKEKNMK